MRVGEFVHPTTAELFVNRIVGDGVLRYRHPRCGRVVIERQADGTWLVTQVEKPDPPPVVCAACGHIGGRHLQSCPKAPWRRSKRVRAGEVGEP